MIYDNIIPITFFLIFFMLVAYISESAMMGIIYTVLTYFTAKIFFGVKNHDTEIEYEEQEEDQQERIEDGERYYIYYDEDGLIRPIPARKPEEGDNG